jgi:outer membrane protein
LFDYRHLFDYRRYPHYLAIEKSRVSVRKLKCNRDRMSRRLGDLKPGILLALIFLIGILDAHGQDMPANFAKPWHSDREVEFAQHLRDLREPPYATDANHTYTLAELIDLAETHNPETRVAWQSAKAAAQSVGLAKSALFPTLTAAAIAATVRQYALSSTGFHRQTLGLSQPVLELNYLIFDFGERSGAIAQAKQELFAADFAFNDIHRQIIYQVTATYYRLLNATGQQDAARATLVNAQAVERNTQSRLDHGLATIPDLLEAQAATAQADYDLQAAVGAVEITQGDLATAVGLPARSQFEVQNIDELAISDHLRETADEAVDRALAQRPDLLEQVATLRAADASIRQIRSTYFPSLSFSGVNGLSRMYGRQEPVTESYAGGDTWSAQLALRWTLFDGARREHALAEAKARRAQVLAQIDSLTDQVAEEVWHAYSDAKTALRQRRAAAALLASADKSYTAALRSYDLGLRNLLDVVAAQRALAQARSADVFARTQVLTQVSNVAFRTGDLLRSPVPRAGRYP